MLWQGRRNSEAEKESVEADFTKFPAKIITYIG